MLGNNKVRDVFHRFLAQKWVRPKNSSGHRRFCPLFAALFAVLLFGTQAAMAAKFTEVQPPPGEAGLFSWSAEEVNKTDGKLFSLMKEEGINTLYQNISSKNSRQEQMSVFVETAMENDITVYYLTGDASWGTDPKGAKLCEAVENAAAYNRRIQRKFLERRKKDGKPWTTVPQLRGIVFDVEPYTLPAWDRNPGKVMASFVSGMKSAYAKAKENGLEVIVCVPWYYDKKGQTKGLEELIKNGCDSIAVMNYYRGAEIKNIATEIELAHKHGKGLITIYELQQADGRSVKEINTYYHSGLKALRENFQKIIKAYPERSVSVAYHDYRALKKVVEEARKKEVLKYE